MTDKPLTCAFGSLWGAKGCGPCAQCEAYGAQLQREFERGVFFGLHDERGFTPSERRAHARRRKDAAA